MTASDWPENVIVAKEPAVLVISSFPPYAALSLVCDQPVEYTIGASLSSITFSPNGSPGGLSAATPSWFSARTRSW